MFKFKVAGTEKSWNLEINSGLPIYDLFLEIGTKEVFPFQISFGFPKQTITRQSHGKLKISDVLDNSSLLKIEEISTERKFCRGIVPADNNCLFTSVRECTNFQQNSLRQVVCNVIKSNPEKFNAVFLEKNPEDYISWISNTNSWGGEIEIEALAEALEICIKVVIIQIPSISVYNPGSKENCIILIYDGIHFDYFQEELGGGLHIKEFKIEDDIAEGEALKIGKKMKEERKFTDTANFTLKCLVCNKGIIGQKEAVQHGKETGHFNFSEF